MKPLVPLMAIALLAPVTFIQAQSPSPGTPRPTASASPSASTDPAAARTDVYHIHFAKATTGKAAELADFLKTPDPKAAMPGHTMLLRHQQGEAWDYVEIEHMGTKATVEAAGTAVPVAMRSLTEWHNDTFVNGPSWSEFTKEMGLTGDAAKGGGVYAVSVYRAAAGHREDLEKFLSQPPVAGTDMIAGTVLMQHLEGSEWTFFSISYYKSWQDFATSETNSVAQSSKGEGGWFDLRRHIASHSDTLCYRIAP